MSNTFKVFGSAQVREFNLSKFDYTADVTALLTELSTKISNSKKEIAKAFNVLCHVAMAQASTAKTKKERHESLASMKERFEKLLPKEYARAFAKGIIALEWEISEDFEDFDFSAFLEKSPSEQKAKEYGREVLIKRWQKAMDSLLDKKTRTAGMEEEIAVYGFILECVKNMPAE